MANFQSQVPRIAELANRLVEDIHTRGLKPGDRYLTTLDASRMLGVGNNVANRALQLLEKRSVIVRQQRKGSFIAHQAHVTRTATPLRRVHLLVHHRYFKTEGTANDGVLVGMQGELPGSSVSISFIPVDGETEFVDSLVAESLNSNVKDGFVLIRSSLETQRHIAASGLPSVVYGSVYPSVQGLPSVNRDSHEIGRSLTRYLLEQGNRRIVYFTRQNVLPGDYATMDAILDTMSQAGLSLDDFVMRALPPDESAAESVAASLLDDCPAPTGFICRHSRFADGVSRVLESKDGREPARSHIVVCDYYLKSGEKARYIYPKPSLTPEQQGQHLGRLLACQARGEEIRQLAEWIPVRLCHPS